MLRYLIHLTLILTTFTAAAAARAADLSLPGTSIDKARRENIIRSLNYAYGDLIEKTERNGKETFFVILYRL